MPFSSKKLIYIVAPDGQTGGGMGRVKDYILEAAQSSCSDYEFRPIVTRDGRGAFASGLLVLVAASRILKARLLGRLALVHVNMGDKGSAVRKGALVVFSRAIGAKVFLHLHAVTLHKTFHNAHGILKFLIAFPFRISTRNIVLGQVWKNWLVDELKVDGCKVDVLRNGVSVPTLGADDRSVYKKVSILFLGNLMERKGIGDLIAALSMLPAGVADWHLIVAGGGDVEKYRDLCAHIGLSGKISFLGWVDRQRSLSLLAASDILVLPSYDEGLPLVILEAMGSGAAVVCTPVGSIPEFLRDRETAVFVEPGDSTALSRILAELVDDPAFRGRLAAAAKSDYDEFFSLTSFCSELSKIYRRGGIDGVEFGAPRVSQ